VGCQRFDCGVGQDAEADASGDGLADGFDAWETDAVVGPLAEGPGVAFEVFLQGAALAETDEGLAEAFVEADLFTAGKAMLGQGQEHEHPLTCRVSRDACRVPELCHGL
jgi:hypothetical protein